MSLTFEYYDAEAEEARLCKATRFKNGSIRCEYDADNRLLHAGGDPTDTRAHHCGRDRYGRWFHWTTP